MESTCLIGVCSQEVRAGDPVDCYTNMSGGELVLPDGVSTESLCPKCSTPCLLVVQLYCPVEPDQDRWIYIHVCPSKCATGANVWMAHRVVNTIFQSPNPSVQEIPKPKPSADNWGSNDADDWGAPPDGEECKAVTLEPPVNMFSQMNIGDSKEKCARSVELNIVTGAREALKSVVMEKRASGFPSWYLEVYDERDDIGQGRSGEDGHVKDLLSEYGDKEGLNNVEGHLAASAAAMEISSAEPYQNSAVMHGNMLFYKFQKTLRKNPEQCVRYVHRGQPLLISPLGNRIPDCPHCGSSREFELQLMPPLIPFLSRKSLDMEFGTVVVYICTRNCSIASNVMTEYILVQDDPDSSETIQLFKTKLPCTDGDVSCND